MNNGPAAFPALNFIVPQDLSDQGCRTLGASRGMSLRDYFAAKAMAAYIDSDFLDRAFTDEDIELTFTNCAAFAYRMADAMLKAREA
jgi:hypothetical protein